MSTQIAIMGSVLAATVTFAGPLQAEVWKCSINGRLQYSNLPCPSDGAPMAPQTLQGNVIETRAESGTAPASAGERTTSASASGSMNAAAASDNVCPTERNIGDMETKASSITLTLESKRFIQDEIRRARQCQKGLGRYSAADWAISRAAIDAQSNLTGAADARRRSEAMHSAANPNEGNLIARQREAEERQAERRNNPPTRQ